MLKIFFISTYITIIVATNCFAQPLYIVQPGDTLSHVVNKRFLGEPLYGSEGKIAEVLSLNPQITNPHLILPKQEIRFVEAEVEAALEPEATIDQPEAVVAREVSFLPRQDYWNVSLLYGAKFVSLAQTGALDKSNFGVVFLNNIKLKSEFVFENWSAFFGFETYKFRFKTNTESDEAQMHAFRLGGGYRWMLLGIGIEQNPLFRNNNGAVEMSRMSIMQVQLGARKNISLPTLKPTSLSLKGWLLYPLESSSDNSDLKLSEVSGPGLRAEVELNRELLNKKNYSLNVIWHTEVGYQKFSQETEWGSAQGKVDTTFTTVSSALGLLLEF